MSTGVFTKKFLKNIIFTVKIIGKLTFSSGALREPIAVPIGVLQEPIAVPIAVVLGFIE